MPKNRVAILAFTAVALFLGVLVAAGCGGGGPLKSSTTPVTAAAQFTALLPAAQKGAVRVGDAACGKCHSTDHTSWLATAHAKALVDCEACHGPGSAHAAAPSTANILN